MEGKYVPSFGILVPHPPSKSPEPKPPPLRRRLPPIKKRYVNEQRGIYSDIVTTPSLQVNTYLQMHLTQNYDRC